MKGKLILVPVKEPKEGMKVVLETGSYGTTTGKLSIRDEWSNEDNPKVIINHLATTFRGISELQQIAIEYEKTLDPLARRPQVIIKTILLSPDDYEKTLPLIGQEIEWEESDFWVEDKGKQSEGYYRAIPHFGKIAKLITPSPIVYKEEEVKILTFRAAQDGMRGHIEYLGGFENWWDKYKKK